MSLTDSLLVSAFSIALVFFVLVMLSLLIVIFSKILEAAKVRSEKEAVQQPADTPAPSVSMDTSPSVPDVSAGTLQLKKVDEKTAAMIMAIVGHESDIPLSELRFKSIRLMEENN